MDNHGFDTYLKVCDYVGGQMIVLNITYSGGCNHRNGKAFDVRNYPRCLGSLCDESDFVIYASNYETIKEKEWNSYWKYEPCEATAAHKLVGGRVIKGCKSSKGIVGLTSTKAPKEPNGNKAPNASKARTLK